MVEHGDAVGRDPDVGLEARRAELERQLERLERVLRRVRARPAVREADRGRAHLPGASASSAFQSG